MSAAERSPLERFNSNDIRAKLHSAFDLSQMYGIFQHMMGVIEEQSQEHQNLTSHIHKLERRLVDCEEMPARIEALTAAVKEMEEDLFGGDEKTTSLRVEERQELRKKRSWLKKSSLQDVHTELQPVTHSLKTAPSLMVLEEEGEEVAYLVEDDDVEGFLRSVDTEFVDDENTNANENTVTGNLDSEERESAPIFAGTENHSSESIRQSTVQSWEMDEGSTCMERGVASSDVTGDSKTATLVPLADKKSFVLVRSEAERAAVLEMETSSPHRQTELLEGFRRSGALVNHVHRFKAGVHDSSAKESIATRVKALEHLTNGHLQLITEQRAAVKAFPVFLEALNAQIVALAADGRGDTNVSDGDELVSRVRAAVMAEVDLRQTALSASLASMETSGRATAVNTAQRLEALEAEVAILKEGLLALQEERQASAALQGKVSRLSSKTKELETSVRDLVKKEAAQRAEWRAELETLSYTVNLQSVQQTNAVRSLMEELAALHRRLEAQPDEAAMRETLREAEARLKL